MVAGADFELVDIARSDRLRVQLAVTDRPWLLPADTLVLPTSPSGALGVLGQAFRKACGSQWEPIQADLKKALTGHQGINVEEPLLVKLGSRISVAPDLGNIILATSQMRDGHFPGIAVKAILGLANRSNVRTLVLPLLGSGAQGEAPVQTAEAALKAVFDGKGELETVMLATLSYEAREWLRSHASPAGAPSPSSSAPAIQPSMPRTASSLLIRELESLGKSASPALAELFATSGRLAAQRRSNNGKLTTSLVLFAAIWLGSKRNPEEPELVFLTRLADEVSKRAGKSYDRLLSEYFSGPPQYLATGAEPSISALSDNTRAMLQRLARADDATNRIVGAPACILALLDQRNANAARNLKKAGVDAAELRKELEIYLRHQAPASPGVPAPSTAKPGESPPIAESEPPGQFIPVVNNDTANAAGADLLTIDNEVEAFARLAASCTAPPPLSIGVFGDWGAGKSFFMERMFAKIEDIKKDKQHKDSPTFYTDIVQIRFNAWHYIETNLWASLVEFIFSELDRWLRLKKEAQGPEVDALFDRLSTSRELRLESYRNLIARRRELRVAEQQLDTAREQNKQALQSAEARPLEDPWTAVVQCFLNAADDRGAKTMIEEAVDDLGLHKLSSELTTSAQELAALIEGTRSQAIRAQTLANALFVRLGSRSGAIVAAAAVLGAPLAMAIVLSALDAAAGWQSLGKLSATMLELASGASAIIAVAGFWLEKARSGLDRIDGLRSKLDEQVVTRTATEREKLAEAQLAADRARQVIADAEKRVAAAKDREVAAKQEFDNETAQGRLNRFIRGKVADADYAKHLGIIASIRKDFGQLTELMQAGKNDRLLRDEIEKSSEQHLKKLEEFLRTSGSLLHKNETDDLEAIQADIRLELKGESKADLPSFERIILYIDDLDRCPPDKVVEVLQAIHLFLYFPLFVVVVAVDARWVSRSLMVRYKDLLSDDRTAEIEIGKPETLAPDRTARRPADARDYLEKLFQLPYWVRRMDEAASKEFVRGLARSFVKVDPLPSDAEKQTASREQQEDRPSIPPDPLPGAEEPEGAAAKAVAPPVAGATEPPQDVKPLAGDPAKPAITFIPMTLSTDEQNDLAEFAAFAGGSPRRAKRYLNLYLLLKTSLRPGAGLPGLNPRVNQRAIIALLAIVTAAGPADSLFEMLAREKPEFTDLASLLGLLEKPSAGYSTKTRDIVAKLKTVNQRDSIDQGVHMLTALRHYAQVVRRYSF